MIAFDTEVHDRGIPDLAREELIAPDELG